VSDQTTLPRGRSAATSFPRTGSREIELELTPAQINGVLGAMVDGENRSRSVVLRGLADARKVIEADRARVADPRMVRALLTGLAMLAAFPSDYSYMSNAEVARAFGLNPSTTLRYLVTFEALGYLERDPATRVITALLMARVDELRKSRALSRERLAGTSGISTWTLAHLSSELSDPRLSVVLRLCRGLGVTAGELLDELPLPIEARRPRLAADLTTGARGTQ
jgi:DNA-binding XRE family transcriptional regulator